MEISDTSSSGLIESKLTQATRGINASLKPACLATHYRSVVFVLPHVRDIFL